MTPDIPSEKNLTLTEVYGTFDGESSHSSSTELLELAYT